MNPADVAAVMGNSNMGEGWWVIILFALIFMNGGWNGNQQAATHADVDRAADNANTLNAINGVGADVQRTAYEQMAVAKDAAYNNLSEIRDLQSAVSLGFANQQSCCCETKQMIMENRYLDAQNTAALQANMDNRFAELEKNQLQQTIDAQAARIQNLELQGAMAGVVRYPMSYAYSAGQSPFCGCSGCSNM